MTQKRTARIVLHVETTWDTDAGSDEELRGCIESDICVNDSMLPDMKINSMDVELT
jgi:hypothetical protein